MPATQHTQAAEGGAALGPLLRPLKLMRMGVAGLLMGLANLVPGVSGGTMILVMGLYDEFISSIADVTRLRFAKRPIFFLVVIVGVAGVAIASLAGPTGRLVESHRSAMYALFIGLTLGGAPLLYSMFAPLRASSVIPAILGLAIMIPIGFFKQDHTAGTASALEANYLIDVFAGVLGVSAMVLPGISGAYMLLVIGRYEAILAAVSAAKAYAISGGKEGDLAALHVLIPVGIGVIVGLVGLSNFLKWLLHHYQKPTLGFLMGILLGSVIGIWPFDKASTSVDFGWGGFLAIIGFAATFALSRITNEDSS